MRVCFEILKSVRLCGGKKERMKRFRCVPLVPPSRICARDPKKNANAHFFFLKSFNQKKREKRLQKEEN